MDNHAIVFDPDDPDYMLVGTGGGVYETFDRTRTWRYVANLPLTQFYRVGIDNMAPFYTVHGGTQDNSSVGGPSRTDNVHGIRSSDWFLTHGGDGFQVRVDPEDPNIVYTQSQYAGIVRYDRTSGEELDIQPQPEAGEGALRWHWDSPLIISPHNSRRVYFAAQKLFRSDDRAETCTAAGRGAVKRSSRGCRPWLTWPTWWLRGTSWTNITGDVPDGQSSWTLVEDHVDPELLFLGTEFGLFATRDGGGSWVRLKGGLPTIAVRDLEIQRREDDLVLATFGRGFYILDDYSPLRRVDEAVGAGAAYLFPVKDPWAYIPTGPP